MNPKIKPGIDLNSLEESYFTLRLHNPLTPDEIQKLTNLGGKLKYDNGNMAIITILPTKLEEFVQLETIIDAR